MIFMLKIHAEINHTKRVYMCSYHASTMYALDKRDR